MIVSKCEYSRAFLTHGTMYDDDNNNIINLFSVAIDSVLKISRLSTSIHGLVCVKRGKGFWWNDQKQIYRLSSSVSTLPRFFSLIFLLSVPNYTLRLGLRSLVCWGWFVGNTNTKVYLTFNNSECYSPTSICHDISDIHDIMYYTRRQTHLKL